MGWKPEETLCFSCSHATKSNCAWSAIGEPVNDWKAEPTPRGYRVIECPRYDCDVYYCSDGTQKLDRNKHRDIDNDGMIALLAASLKLLKEDYINGFGPVEYGRGKTRAETRAANRRYIEAQIRRPFFTGLYHIDNPEDLIKFLRKELAKHINKYGDIL